MEPAIRFSRLHFIALYDGQHAEVMVDLLVKAGTNVNKSSPSDGANPLIRASQRGHAEVADLLVKTAHQGQM